MNRVGITAPSGNVLDIEVVERARALFEGRGWDVTVGESVYSSSMRFGGSSESARTTDFNHMCMKEELVLCARGGYGFSRILPGVDFSVI
ncbi:LD-carboxypeptidase, partial [uncultured Parasutterella sp.]